MTTIAIDRTLRIAAGVLVAACLGSRPAEAAQGGAPANEPGTRVVAPTDGGGLQASAAAHRAHGRSPHRVRSYYPRSHGWYLGWGPYLGGSWGGYWGGYWDPYWYGPRGGYPPAYPRGGERYGALDTDLSPERAEVWIDGRKVGLADDFDGFPSYLWLEEGTYDVVFYLPGYTTLSRQYSIYPGLVIDVEDRLERGEAVHPLDLGPPSHERRDERLRRDRERREGLEAGSPEPEARGALRSDDWLDARGEPGRLRLRIEPADASIYLDGRFVGTGNDLARLRAGLLIDSGRHTLEVVRPGFGSVEREVEIEQGEETELSIELDRSPAGEP